MHETRNFLLVIALVAAVVWAILAWFILGRDTAWLMGQRITSLVLIAGTGIWLVYALKCED